MSIEKRPNGWLARPFIAGKRVSRLFPTKREALEWERQEKAAQEAAGKPLGDGAQNSTLLEAMALFAQRETLYKKGWLQELNRINKWRELASLPRLAREDRDDGPTIIQVAPGAALPRTLDAFRDARLSRSRKADLVRVRLGTTTMDDIATHDLQDLERAMRDGGLKPDTIRIEMALLKRLFNVSRDSWNWRYRAFPFTKYRIPAPGAQRTERIPPEKEQALLEQLGRCRSPFILPYVLLAIETTMRRSEVLFTATWDDVDLPNRTIRLYTDKAGPGRDVPLSQAAVELLENLPRKDGDKRIFPLTGNQLQSAWRKACERAGIEGLRVHDLRHEGTSRYALQMKGNVFLMKKITGHRSTKMLERYVNITNRELFNEMDACAGKGTVASLGRGHDSLAEQPQFANANRVQPLAGPPRLHLVKGSRR